MIDRLFQTMAMKIVKNRWDFTPGELNKASQLGLFDLLDFVRFMSTPFMKQLPLDEDDFGSLSGRTPPGHAPCRSRTVCRSSDLDFRGK